MIELEKPTPSTPYDGRDCDLKTFINLLRGKDNRGANVDPEDEPGNQLGGIDVRWSLPQQRPLAIYMQRFPSARGARPPKGKFVLAPPTQALR